MSSQERVLVKLGGSLLRLPQFPELIRFLIENVSGSMAFVFGGGKAADLVREWDQLFQLGEIRSHRLALRSLDLTAHLALELLPDCRLAGSLEEMELIHSEGKTPILQARTILDQIARSPDAPVIEHSWRFTTDSIAATIAVQWQANRLILVKSIPPPREGLGDPLNKRPTGNLLEQAVQQAAVDPCFDLAASSLPQIDWLNGQQNPWGIEAWWKGD